MTENPFFENWTTPFGLPPFDRIRPEHFPPAFDRGMAEQYAEIAAITGTAAAPSFANTIETLERSGRLLDRVSRVFFNLDPATPTRRSKRSPAITRPSSPSIEYRSPSTQGLFGRIAELYARRETLGLSRRPDAAARALPSAPGAQRRVAAVRKKRRAWRRSPSAWRSCIPSSGRTYCTTSAIGSWCSMSPTSTGCPISPGPLRRRPPRSAGSRGAGS